MKAIKDYYNDPDALRVAYEVCMPNRTAYFDDLSLDVTDVPDNLDTAQAQAQFEAAKRAATSGQPPTGDEGARVFQRIRQWRGVLSPQDYPQSRIYGGDNAQNSGGYGDATTMILLFGATERDQPVFYEWSIDRPEEILAVHISVSLRRFGKEQPSKFWFKLPKNLAHGSYTAWMVPVDETSSQGNLTPPTARVTSPTPEKILPVYQAPNDAPRIRFTLMSMRENSERIRSHQRARLGASVARARAANPSTPVGGLSFVDPDTPPIPACGEAPPLTR